MVFVAPTVAVLAVEPAVVVADQSATEAVAPPRTRAIVATIVVTMRIVRRLTGRPAWSG